MELKTLKDIDLNYEDIWDLNKPSPEDALKQEAIKWIKHKDEDGSTPKNVQNWIKHFFNITDEELKCHL